MKACVEACWGSPKDCDACAGGGGSGGPVCGVAVPLECADGLGGGGGGVDGLNWKRFCDCRGEWNDIWREDGGVRVGGGDK